MKNDTENENRTTLFGAVVEEMNNGRTKVSYTDAATGDMIERVLLNDMIDATMKALTSASDNERVKSVAIVA